MPWKEVTEYVERYEAEGLRGLESRSHRTTAGPDRTDIDPRSDPRSSEISVNSRNSVQTRMSFWFEAVSLRASFAPSSFTSDRLGYFVTALKRQSYKMPKAVSLYTLNKRQLSACNKSVNIYKSKRQILQSIQKHAAEGRFVPPVFLQKKDRTFGKLPGILSRR
jgi:hypothetical protein